jgi:hypothetical protein
MTQTTLEPEFRIPVLHVTDLAALMCEMRRDASTVRHREVRWTASPIRELDGRSVRFKELILGYITERDGRLTIVELRRLSGTTADDSRSEEIYSERAVANTMTIVERAARELGVRVRPGRFDVYPSPLMPTLEDLHRAFCPHFTSHAGTTYRPWSDGWAVGLECVRSDGLCTFVYVEPAQEQDGRATVFCHLGAVGDPTGDVVQHAYDPFDPEQLTRTYAVVSENGERNWIAEDAEHARRQHEEAFGSEPGETITDVYLSRSDQQTNLPRIHIDSAATETVILDGMMRLAQRLSCGHPDSHWVAVIAALRQMKEAADA